MLSLFFVFLVPGHCLKTNCEDRWPDGASFGCVWKTKAGKPRLAPMRKCSGNFPLKCTKMCRDVRAFSVRWCSAQVSTSNTAGCIQNRTKNNLKSTLNKMKNKGMYRETQTQWWVRFTVPCWRSLLQYILTLQSAIYTKKTASWHTLTVLETLPKIVRKYEVTKIVTNLLVTWELLLVTFDVSVFTKLEKWLFF